MKAKKLLTLLEGEALVTWLELTSELQASKEKHPGENRTSAVYVDGLLSLQTIASG